MSTLDLIEEYKARRVADKRQVWIKLQRDCPDVAVFLTEFNRVFGKPGKLRITGADGKVIFETGQSDG